MYLRGDTKNNGIVLHRANLSALFNQTFINFSQQIHHEKEYGRMKI